MDLQFINGRADIKSGRKIIASIFDRAIYYPAHKIRSSYSPKYPFSLEIRNVGMRECESLPDALFYLNKWTNPEVLA